MATKTKANTKANETQEVKAPEEVFEIFKARVVYGDLNKRKKADVKSPVVEVLPCGAEVEVLGREGEWYKVKGGFILKKFTDKINADE